MLKLSVGVLLSIVLMSGCGSSNVVQENLDYQQSEEQASDEQSAFDTDYETRLAEQQKNPPKFGEPCDTPGYNNLLSTANTLEESIALGEEHFALICDEIDGVWRDFFYRQAREEQEMANQSEGMDTVDTNSRDYITGLTIGNNFSDFSDAGAVAEEVCATARDRRVVVSSRGGVGVDPRTASFLDTTDGFQGCIDGFNGVPQD